MNSFDDFTLSGANITRYVPILGNAKGIIGAYRRVAETIGIGQVPLFLLDGELDASLLSRAVETLHLTVYVAIYRPFDVKLKKRFEAAHKNVRKGGFVNKDGSVAEWVTEHRDNIERIRLESGVDYGLGIIQPYLDYTKAQEEYTNAIKAPCIDAVTGNVIADDLNEFLYERAKTMFPLGVESMFEVNTKQSAIPKTEYFVDGLENAPAPKGVRQYGKQMTLFDFDRPGIDDAVTELCEFYKDCINQNGAVMMSEILTHCAEMGLYKGNVTLYIIGASFRFFFSKGNAIFYDGVAYWQYTEVRDISSWILRIYDCIQPRLVNGKLTIIRRKAAMAAMFFDNTTLKERLESIFSLEPTQDKRLDTLGMAIVQIGKWVVDNLRYPIAFLDNMLYCLYRENCLYGDKLHQYDDYFTVERCEWIKARLPHADTIARQAIKEAVGFDPDKVTHSMSNLSKGHSAPILYSAEGYIEEILRKPRIAI